MKKPITVRVDVGLLAEARRCAMQENRTLTNFIETVLRHRIDEMTPGGPLDRRHSPRPGRNGPTNAA
jgi:hypothetical protein